jgi:hypothetical protein
MIQKISLAFISLLICSFVLEVTARKIRGPRWLNPYYVEISKGFPELEELIADTQDIYPSQAYYDEFLYAAAPISTKHINFTDYYSARWTPDSVDISEADHIIWTFGGSTMENTETTDSLSIANTWAKVFNNELGPSHVKNFGSGGFNTSYELIKFQKLLREVPQNELPTIAIFYDGYNDALYGFQYGPGSLQKDLSLKLQALVEYDDLKIGTYALSRYLSQYSALWERTAARLVEVILFPLPEPSTDDGNLEGAIRVYTSNLRMIQAICVVYQIQCFFVLQPLVVTKEPLSEMEQEILDSMEAHPRFGSAGSDFIRLFYDRVITEFSIQDNFIDASRILDGREESDFYDLGHTSVLSAPIIGERVIGLILERLKN